MRPAFLSRSIHKWLALVVGLQFVLWTLSGFYMAAVDLDFIHGDPLVRNLRVPVDQQQPVLAFSEIVQRYPLATDIALRGLPGFAAPMYEVTTNGRKVLLNAVDGRPVSPLDDGAIHQLSRAYYAGKGQLVRLTLIERDAPLEIQGRALPLWRADFDDWLDTSLYLHPDTGALVTRRHRFWRWFDFLWMLHILDFDTRTDVNNALLRTSTVIGLGGVASGAWLLYLVFRRSSRAPIGQ